MGIGEIIGWLIVGAIAGWIAEQVLGRKDGLVTNIIIGIVGALIGGVLFNALSVESGWIWSILVSAICAIVLLWIVGMVRRRT